MSIYVGELPEDVKDRSGQAAVLSPGVPTDNPLVNELRELGARITGEIELAYEYGQGDLLAITGTNGKTTTTTLVGEICRIIRRRSRRGDLCRGKYRNSLYRRLR